MDISADLTELGKTPVTVVSAGVKSILDIPRTLEVLVSVLIFPFVHLLSVNHVLCCLQETQGVTVIAYGDSKEFPAFFVHNSGSMVRGIVVPQSHG